MPERLVAGPQQGQKAAVRHFVFAPGGTAERNQPGYYALSFIVFVGMAFLIQAFCGYVLTSLAQDNKALHDALDLARNRASRVPWRWHFLFYGIVFLTFWISLAAAVKIVHRRKLLSVFTERSRFDVRRAGLGFAIYTLILIVPFLFFIATERTDLKAQFHPSQLAQLFAFSTALFLLQVSTEEAIFRGYLTQFAASLTDARPIIILTTSILFALAHLDNPEVVRVPQLLLFYFGFGVFMSLIVFRERGLELVIGAHFANNLVNSVLLRPENGLFQTPSIFVLPAAAQGEPVTAVLTGSIAPVLYWLITMLLRRRPAQPTNS